MGYFNDSYPTITITWPVNPLTGEVETHVYRLPQWYASDLQADLNAYEYVQEVTSDGR